MAKPKITPREKMLMELVGTKAGEPYAGATETVQKLSDKALDLNELLLLKSLNTRAVSNLDMEEAVKDLYRAMLETIKETSQLKGVKTSTKKTVMEVMNVDNI